MPEPASEPAPPPLYETVIKPTRSLPPRGFFVLMALLGSVSTSVGLVFYLIGAWPVVGFMGLDVGLVYVAFRASYRHARAYEHIRLTRDELTVERVTHQGRRRLFRFQPYWLRVELYEPGGRQPQLRLSSHGRSLVLGSFLAPVERRSLAEALREALAEVRRPDFGTA